MAHAVPGLMDECAGEIATRLHIYDNRLCEHAAPPDIRLPQDPSWQFEAHFLYRDGNSRVSPVLLTRLVNIAHPNQWGKLQCGTNVGMPKRVDDWPLTRLQQHLVKTGDRKSSMRSTAAGASGTNPTR